FAPVRLLLGLDTALVTTLFALAIGLDALPKGVLIAASAGAFVVSFELLLPMLIVGRDPERVLELLLPSFNPIARALAPITGWATHLMSVRKRQAPMSLPDEAEEPSSASPTA